MSGDCVGQSIGQFGESIVEGKEMKHGLLKGIDIFALHLFPFVRSRFLTTASFAETVSGTSTVAVRPSVSVTCALIG